MPVITKFKTPKEAKKDAQRLVNDIASMDNDSMEIADIFQRAKNTINTMLNQENVKLNTLLLVALKQKMSLLEKVYKLLNRCLDELMNDSRLNTFNINSNDLMDKTIKLMESFASILDGLTNKNDVINFNFTNNLTQNNVKGEIAIPDEVKERLKMFALQYKQMKEANENNTIDDGK